MKYDQPVGTPPTDEELVAAREAHFDFSLTVVSCGYIGPSEHVQTRRREVFNTVAYCWGFTPERLAELMKLFDIMKALS